MSIVPAHLHVHENLVGYVLFCFSTIFACNFTKLKKLFVVKCVLLLLFGMDTAPSH